MTARDDLAERRDWLARNQPTYERMMAERRELIRTVHADGATIAELSRLAGVSRTAVYNILRG